jgi:hypothetical protein
MRLFAAIVALCAGLFLTIAGRHWWTGDPRQASQRTIGVAILILLASTMVAAATGRATKHWGGSDLPVSCETVRSYRAEIAAMSPETKTKLAQSFGVTRKQRRQAMACLRKVN